MLDDSEPLLRISGGVFRIDLSNLLEYVVIVILYGGLATTVRYGIGESIWTWHENKSVRIFSVTAMIILYVTSKQTGSFQMVRLEDCDD